MGLDFLVWDAHDCDPSCRNILPLVLVQPSSEEGLGDLGQCRGTCEEGVPDSPDHVAGRSYVRGCCSRTFREVGRTECRKIYASRSGHEGAGQILMGDEYVNGWDDGVDGRARVFSSQLQRTAVDWGISLWPLQGSSWCKEATSDLRST